MKILVANLGSTSFKYRLFDMRDERQLARGGTERIGSAESRSFIEIGDRRREFVSPVPDHAVAVRQCLEHLADPQEGCLQSASEVAAIGFKAVHGGRYSDVQRVTPDVLTAMEAMHEVAPAHNPPYVTAMRLLSEKLPEIPLVAAFETGFHQTIPDRQKHYAIPWQWTDEHLVRRWGFHGASHRYIAGRTAELLGRQDLRIISCHLGGSNSLCAIRNGQSVATSLGMSPQSGLPHNNRVGDFDVFALPVLIERTGKTLNQLLEEMANQGGLLGISGTSGDIRDLEAAAASGHARSELALALFATSIRNYLGASLVELGGADALVFTGGIGENSYRVRRDVCRDLAGLGIMLDEIANMAPASRERERLEAGTDAGSLTTSATHRHLGERPIHAASSRTQIWVIPTNEEIVVARQAKQLLESGG
ncbi:MAG TPA: acetate/propionate family kinase [Pirellulales bacterium]|jgi:acetate kinase|nr:acetate/propionate family kinase [Pirellulales bacterium]